MSKTQLDNLSNLHEEFEYQETKFFEPYLLKAQIELVTEFNQTIKPIFQIFNDCKALNSMGVVIYLCLGDKAKKMTKVLSENSLFILLDNLYSTFKKDILPLKSKYAGMKPKEESKSETELELGKNTSWPQTLETYAEKCKEILTKIETCFTKGGIDEYEISYLKSQKSPSDPISIPEFINLYAPGKPPPLLTLT